MTAQHKTFFRPDTGEAKPFAREGLRPGRAGSAFHCYRATDGHRLDPQPDGGYRDGWGVVWVAAATCQAAARPALAAA